MGMGGDAWRVPFFVFAAATFVVVMAAFAFFRAKVGGALRLLPPFLPLVAFSAPTFVVIVGLWFFSFWSVQIVKEAAQCSLLAAALTAAFNAGAGIIGFPAGGWLADWAVRTGRSRKMLALICTAVYSVLGLLFGLSIQGGGKPSLVLLGLLLFTSGLFFNALQPIVQGMTGDMVPANERGSAFGMLNLISEIGAVASPVVSGILHDATGSWAPGVYLAIGIMIVSSSSTSSSGRPRRTTRTPSPPSPSHHHVTTEGGATASPAQGDVPCHNRRRLATQPVRHFPLNAWYAAAWDHEVGRNLLAKTVRRAADRVLPDHRRPGSRAGRRLLAPAVAAVDGQATRRRRDHVRLPRHLLRRRRPRHLHAGPGHDQPERDRALLPGRRAAPLRVGVAG